MRAICSAALSRGAHSDGRRLRRFRGVSDNSYDIAFDFSNDFQGWVAGFTDYPVGKETEWALGCVACGAASTTRRVAQGHSPHGREPQRRPVHVHHARGDGARCLTRSTRALPCDARHQCAEELRRHRRARPGESVVLKVGATAAGARADRRCRSQYYRANFDHGAQLAGGRDATPLGQHCHVEHELRCRGTSSRSSTASQRRSRSRRRERAALARRRRRFGLRGDDIGLHHVGPRCDRPALGRQ